MRKYKKKRKQFDKEILKQVSECFGGLTMREECICINTIEATLNKYIQQKCKGAKLERANLGNSI